MSRVLPIDLLLKAIVVTFMVGGPFAAAGCNGPDDGTMPDDPAVLIMAASSTQDALEEIAAALRQAGGPAASISPAGSNALAQQIIAGAPGDLFLSAHPAWAEEVASRGHAAEAMDLLSGQLVIVVPAGNPAGVQGPDDLLSDRMRRLALAGEHVPAGMYAAQALKKAGVYESMAAAGRIVRGQNVRFTLAYVERGEAEAGVVYASDAAVASSVEVVHTFDRDAHDPIIYPLVLLKRGGERKAARQVFEFLQSAEAAAIFEAHGFRPLTALPQVR